MAAERMSTAAMAYPAMAYPVAESAHRLSLDELTDLPPSAAISDAHHRYALLFKEAELLSKLQAVGDYVDRIEEHAHGVLRVDPPSRSHEDGMELDISEVLRDRALRRVEEWAAVFGGGRVTLSEPLVLPAAPTAATPQCTCRREAWVVQMQTALRRVQVAAARFSALPPDGRDAQLLDVTWLDEVNAPAKATANASSSISLSGVPRLIVLYASVSPEASYNIEALCSAMRSLDLPPIDYAHLRTQRLLQPDKGCCEALARCLEVLGEEVSSWCRLEEPLAPWASGVLELARTPAAEQTSPLRARADLAVRQWESMDRYVAAAVVGAAQLGQHHWLTKASANLRESGVHGGVLDTPLSLLLALAAHPRADSVRKRRVAQIFDWLSVAPAPFGPAISQAAKHVRERLRS